MTNYTVLYLKNFKGGLHLARGLNNSYDKTLQTLHSDTLKSALFACALQLYGEKQINKESFLEKFTISSAFPFYQAEDKKLHFFPKPEVATLNFEIKDENGLEKKLKKVRFFEKELFEDFLKDANKKRPFKEEDLAGSFLGKLESGLKNKLPKEGLMQTEPYQHVQISRDYGTDSTPYYVDKIYFHENAGLFCLVKEEESEVLDKVKAAFKLLADNGIGTDRNSGNGQFDYEIGSIDLKTPEINDKDEHIYEVSLSLYLPKKEELGNIENGFYGLTKRGGYISNPQNENNLTIRKRSIYMFTEGSFFPAIPHRVGKVENLKPDEQRLSDSNIRLEHDIWRDGRALFVKMKYRYSDIRL